MNADLDTSERNTAFGVAFMTFDKKGNNIVHNRESQDCFNYSSVESQQAMQTFIDNHITGDKPPYSVALTYNRNGAMISSTFYDHGTETPFDHDKYPEFLKRYFPQPAKAKI